MWQYILYSLIFVILVVMAWLRLYPKRYPGIPYNEASANRITGDMPDLVSVIKEMDESSNTLFTA